MAMKMAEINGAGDPNHDECQTGSLIQVVSGSKILHVEKKRILWMKPQICSPSSYEAMLQFVLPLDESNTALVENSATLENDCCFRTMAVFSL